MRKFVASLLTAIMFLSIAACTNGPENNDFAYPSLNKGELIQFGGHEWRVLDVQSNRALIITDRIIESRAYHNEYREITWFDCDLRQYLNGDFYERFSVTERARIVEVTNQNLDNQWHGTNGGVDTQDNVFLLSIEEVVKFFGDSGQLASGNFDDLFWLNDEYSANRAAFHVSDWMNSDGEFPWWLRSPGFQAQNAGYVAGGGRDGTGAGWISMAGGIIVGETMGVRPAMWISTDNRNEASETFQETEPSAYYGHDAHIEVRAEDIELVMEPLFDFDSAWNFNEGLAVVVKDGFLGYININGEIVVQPQFDGNRWENGFFSEGFAAVSKDGKWGYINPRGDLVVSMEYDMAYPFSEGFATVEKDGQYAYINARGEVIVPFGMFDNILIRQGFSEGFAAVSKDGKWGYINIHGDIAVPLEFDAALPFSEGLAAVVIDRQLGYINTRGEVVVPFEFERVSANLNDYAFREGLAAVSNGGKWGYINTGGELVVPLAFESAGHFSEGFAPVFGGDGFGFINTSGEIVVPMEYWVAYGFNEGLGLVAFVNDLTTGDLGVGYVDSGGNVVIPLDFHDAHPFNEGLAVVAKDDNWGYVNTRGEVVVPLEFDNVTDFNDGYALVQRNGLWGILRNTAINSANITEALHSTNGTDENILLNMVGHSMAPTIHDGDTLNAHNSGNIVPKAGDIVAFTAESFPDEILIRRIIAVVGDSIDIDESNNSVFVNGLLLDEPYIFEPMERISGQITQFPIIIPIGYCFVMGDNRNFSIDSRDPRIGFVAINSIVGIITSVSGVS